MIRRLTIRFDGKVKEDRKIFEWLASLRRGERSYTVKTVLWRALQHQRLLLPPHQRFARKTSRAASTSSVTNTKSDDGFAEVQKVLDAV